MIKKTTERRRHNREASSRSQTRGSIKATQKRIKAKEIRDKKHAPEQERQMKIRAQSCEGVRRQREKVKESSFLTTDKPPGFQNRTSRKCGTDKVQHALLATPRKKA